MKKVILIICFWIASLYSSTELTRYILAYEAKFGSAPGFSFEIWFIWIGYAIMMTLFCAILFTKLEDIP